MASGPEVVQMLMQRGLSPVQAAALAGHMSQESGFNPAAYNPQEGAFGLIQHRLDRRDALNNFAGSRGVAPTDLPTQLDFILQEMRTTEKNRGGADFLAGGDLPTLHAALKRYIRYGDDSDAKRIANAQALLGGTGGAVAAPAAATPFGMSAPAATGEAPKAPDVSALLKILQSNQQDDEQVEPSISPIRAHAIDPIRLSVAQPIGLAGARKLLSHFKGIT